MPDSRWVCRRQTRGDEFRGLSRVILPVVIRDQERSIVVAQFQRWIGQRIRHTEGGQARPDAAHDNPVSRRAWSAQDEARDHDVVARADKGPRADIGQLRENGLTEIVDFNQTDTRGALFLPLTIAV